MTPAEREYHQMGKDMRRLEREGASGCLAALVALPFLALAGALRKGR